MSLVRAFEEQATTNGHQSLIKESTKFAEELGVGLELSFPEPKCRDKNGQEVPLGKVKGHLKRAVTAGKESFSRRGGRRGTFTHYAEIVEFHEQLTPTKLYTVRKAKATQVNEVSCRMYSKARESSSHALAGCPALALNNTTRLSRSCFSKSRGIWNG